MLFLNRKSMQKLKAGWIKPPMPHGWLGIVCHSAACRDCIKVQSMAAFGTYRPRAAGSRRRGCLAAEPSQRPTEGCEITMINNYNYLQMCQLLSRSGCL